MPKTEVSTTDGKMEPEFLVDAFKSDEDLSSTSDVHSNPETRRLPDEPAEDEGKQDSSGEPGGEKADTPKGEKKEIPDEKADATGDDDDDLIKPDDPKGVQKRINRAVKRQRQAERAAQEESEKRKALEDRIAALESRETHKEAATDDLVKPVVPEESNFESFEEYQAATRKYISDLTDWTEKAAERAAERAVQKDREERNKAEKERAAREAEQQREKMVDDGRKKYQDFEEVALDPDITSFYTDDMAVAVESSPVFVDLAYHLGQHADEIERIAALPNAIARVREIARIEARLEAELASKTDNKQPESSGKKRTTKADAPIQPVAGDSGGLTKRPEDMSNAEYWAMRRKQQRPEIIFRSD